MSLGLNVVEMIYEGKAKKLYSTDNSDELVLEFKNDLTAFNALKKGSFEGKSLLNLAFSEMIFSLLESEGIRTHRIKKLDDKRTLVKKLTMIPLEVVVRNKVAGSLAVKMKMEEGASLKKPIVEFYYKSDALQDPFLNSQQILSFGFAAESDLVALEEQALKINSVMLSVCQKAGISLIDFKIEFGKDSTGNVLLADEISPDSCRFWDLATGRKLDKDVFRRDLGSVEEAYQEVYQRLKKVLS